MGAAKRVVAIEVKADDLAAAPPWVKDLLALWTQNLPWTITVYQEVQGEQVVQHFDVSTGDQAIWATGTFYSMMRHVRKGSVDIVSRGAILEWRNGTLVPGEFLEHLQRGEPAYLDEYAWLLGVSRETLASLVGADDPMETLQRLVPDIQAIWQNHYNLAKRAVNLQ